MFFIMGIDQKTKEIEYNGNGMNICKSCGAYTRYTVFMTYMCLSIFFIPLIKWSKKYYAKTSCCESVYELSKEKGEMIKSGEDVLINDCDLTPVYEKSRKKICKNCGFETDEDFKYCPQCSSEF